MARKKKQIEEEIKKELSKLEDLKSTLEASVAEEDELIARTKKKIDKLCNDEGLDCCVIVNKSVMLTIIDTMLSNPGENFRIQYDLYIKE
jgi:hypothetical protein